jgi:hypothetical protein
LQRGENGTEKETGTKQRNGKGKGKGKGKVLLNTAQGEMISLVSLLCSCRRNGISLTWTLRAI